jgi:hypothetical protein
VELIHLESVAGSHEHDNFCHESMKLIELREGTLQEKLCLINAVTCYNEHNMYSLLHTVGY